MLCHVFWSQVEYKIVCFICELCSFSHKLFNSEPSAEKPHSTYDCKTLNARMVMVALESGNTLPYRKYGNGSQNGGQRFFTQLLWREKT